MNDDFSFELWLLENDHIVCSKFELFSSELESLYEEYKTGNDESW